MSVHPAATHPDPYDLNLAGLIAFNPVLPALRRTLGSEVEIEPPTMWPGPELELHRGVGGWGDDDDRIRIKLDFSGTTHVMHHGREITDERAAALLGISERAFARGHAVAETGLKAGELAMTPATPEVVEAPTAEQRLAAAQRRDTPSADPDPQVAPRW